MKFAATLLSVLCAALALPGAAAAQSVTLRIADTLPSGSVLHRYLALPYIEAVEKASGGQVKFQHFPGGQLGKANDMLALTQSGLVDVGYVGPSYQSEKMPLSSVFELPGAFGDYCQGIRALWKMTHAGGFLEKNEFTPNKIVPLLISVLPAYQLILSTSKKIDGIKDLSGMKIRTAGGATEFQIRNLGMVPVRMSPAEIYESMSRGTIDGSIGPYQSVASYGLVPLIKSGTVGDSFGTVVLSYSIGEAKFKQLPENVRNLLLKTGEQISTGACKQFAAAENEAIDKIKAGGMKVIQFSAADQKLLDKAYDEVAADWAASLDKRGKPGSVAVAALRKAVAESK